MLEWEKKLLLSRLLLLPLLLSLLFERKVYCCDDFSAFAI
jgi:hypothetical protein